MTSEQPKIDEHHHIVLPQYAAALAGMGITSAGGRPLPHWDLEETSPSWTGRG